MADESKDYSGSPANPQGEVKTFTQEELNTIISERVNALNASHQKAMDEAVKKALKEQSDKARIESLQGEEKVKAEYQAKLDAIEADRVAKEKELMEATRALAISKAEAQLASLGLPTEFAVNLLGEDDKTTQKNIQTFNTKVNELVTAKVNESLARGGPQIGTVKPAQNAMAEIDRAMAAGRF